MKAPKAKVNHEKGIVRCLETAKHEFTIPEILEHDVQISLENLKMGAVASVSLPPIVTCHNCAECKKYCYAVRSYNRMGENRNPWTLNLRKWQLVPDEFFSQISEACYMFRFFRWHVSGDIPTADYFAGMVRVAAENPHCEFLAFTKNYECVNTYCDENGGIQAVPKNLHILFSAAPVTAMNNRYNFPECHINFADPEKNTFKGCAGKVNHCIGNCEQCIGKKCGCFHLQPGDVTIINQH